MISQAVVNVFGVGELHQSTSECECTQVIHFKSENTISQKFRFSSEEDDFQFSRLDTICEFAQD